MKSSFPGYYRPSVAQFTQLWASALFAFDANVRLSLYGYSKRTRNSLLELFESIRDRLWMPHQFAAEFQRNRMKAISEQVENYRSVKKQLESLIEQHLKPRHRHPFITTKSMQAVKTICKELETGLRHHQSLFG
jgi:hypothetical protein